MARLLIGRTGSSSESTWKVTDLVRSDSAVTFMCLNSYGVCGVVSGLGISGIFGLVLGSYRSFRLGPGFFTIFRIFLNRKCGV